MSTVTGSRIRDLSLASKGRDSIYLAESRMPSLLRIRDRFSRVRPLAGLRVGACLHVTRETAVLARTLKAGGAEVFLAGSNPLSTQDDVAAALVEEGSMFTLGVETMRPIMTVFARFSRRVLTFS